MTLIKNPFFIGYLVVYLICLLLLNSSKDSSITEPLAILFIVGVVFSGLAFLLTKSSKPMRVIVRATKAEMLALLLCLILVTSYLTWGRDALNALLLNSTRFFVCRTCFELNSKTHFFCSHSTSCVSQIFQIFSSGFWDSV